MRTKCAIVASIAVFVVSPVFADSKTGDEADIAQRKADIQRQEQRIKDLLKLLDNDRAAPAARSGAKTALIAPENTGRRRSKDYFDLMNLSVICFSRDGRPVCDRTGDE